MKNETVGRKFDMGEIPKIIHYCWVGGKEKPASVQYCIESWKRFCPDYIIKEWNESNYDFSKNKYMWQAYEAKKWGFVPDYARLDIIYEHGGIYLDTDVELVKSYDSFLDKDAFMGFENTGDGEFFVNCGHGFGATPHNEIIKCARDLYDNISFINEDGSYNMIPSPYYTTQTLRQFGLVQENRDQLLRGMSIYASDVFCPKTFRTGEMNRTERTVSIHHFTASWMDEKIKAELEHQQKINKKYGKHLGNYVLLAESVWKKYSLKEMVTILPFKIVRKIKCKAVCAIESGGYYRQLLVAKFQKAGEKLPALLDTSAESDNAGDQIIMECCLKELPEKCRKPELIRIPTHRFATAKEKEELKEARYKILCGTNILSGKMRSYGLWKTDSDISPYRNTILMGVGFDSKSYKSDYYTRMLFRTILDKRYIHSVRDTFSEKMLRKMGIKNVIFTGCPTMWKMDKEHCKQIPQRKAKNVICTITDYNRDYSMDKKMLEILLETYEIVYFWIQGSSDLSYLHELGYEEKVVLIPSVLNKYDEILQQDDLDYVGTRLHAGIKAMNALHRSIIISIDNRAECISRDTGLPIILRKDIPVCLKEKIVHDFSTEINLPWENIRRWKKQFM